MLSYTPCRLPNFEISASAVFRRCPARRECCRRVTHQAFYINELGRLNAVFFPDGGGVHGDGLLVGRQQNGRGIVHQLQAVPVAGRQQRGAAGSLTGSSQRA